MENSSNTKKYVRKDELDMRSISAKGRYAKRIRLGSGARTAWQVHDLAMRKRKLDM